GTQDDFAACAGSLLAGVLRDAVGYRVEHTIAPFKWIAGVMIEAPMLWIRHTRFPILCISYDQRYPDVLDNVINQLQMAKAVGYFAILVVVPATEGTGNEAEELRHTVANSVYRYDLAVLDRKHVESIVAQSSSKRLVEIIVGQGID